MTGNPSTLKDAASVPFVRDNNLANGPERQFGQPVQPRLNPNQIAYEVEGLIRANQWQAIVDRCYPVAEKLPSLVEAKRDIMIRGKLAFAFSHLKRFDDAIAELAVCLNVFPGNFVYQSAMAFNAYNALYADKNKEIRLKGSQRQEYIRMAHEHFQQAQALRPDNVTTFYREGMLYKQIEAKPQFGLGRFLRAVKNWEMLPPQIQRARHQERKNYIKALYQAASTLLQMNSTEKSLELLEKCLAADSATHYIDRVFKYFALGKIRFAMNQFGMAREALEWAVKSRKPDQPADFVYELLSRVLLAMEEPGRALSCLDAVPARRKRPYIRWTEADVYCALNRPDEARSVLFSCKHTDRISRHKTLIRLAMIEYRAERFKEAIAYCVEADAFFRKKWGNPYIDSMFWIGMCALKLNRVKEAGAVAENMNRFFPDTRMCGQLNEALEARREDGGKS